MIDCVCFLVHGCHFFGIWCLLNLLANHHEQLLIWFNPSLGTFNLVLDSQFFLWFVAQSTFFQFFNPDFLRGFGVGVLNGSLWTIALELQFYILTPILFWLVSKNRIFFGLLLVLFLILNMTRDIMPFNGILAKLYSVSFFLAHFASQL